MSKIGSAASGESRASIFLLLHKASFLDMVGREGFGCSSFRRGGFGYFSRTVFALWVVHILVSQPVDGLRPLRERARSWGDEWLLVRKDKNDLGPFSEWNITGTYRGSWSFQDSTNNSSRFPDFRNSNGNSIIELISTPTKISGVHYVQGVVIFHDVIGNEHDVGGVQIKIEGVYIWPFRQLRMVANSGKGGEYKQEVDSILSNPYHLARLPSSRINVLGVFSSQVFQESPQENMWRRSHCNFFSLGLQPAFDQVESLFNAFATAAFFKFVVFSIFEMRYLLAIWKASRPMNNGEGWETMRRELSVLYSRFCEYHGILLGGIFLMYELHRFLRPILLLMYSFWIPQIVTNVIRDSRKPLHIYYILGITITRLAIPLYVFGCPHNFMRIQPDKTWCICLGVFTFLQVAILLLQHYFGSRWFIPRQVRIDERFLSSTIAGHDMYILPEKYSYYRRLDQNGNHATDCVICMTTIDVSRPNDCMVRLHDFLPRFSRTILTQFLISFRLLHVIISSILMDGYKDGMPDVSPSAAACLIVPSWVGKQGQIKAAAALRCG
ncbi:TUL1, partial [Cucurbita argyrosperma subsp. argyrosperma]